MLNVVLDMFIINIFNDLGGYLCFFIILGRYLIFIF